MSERSPIVLRGAGKIMGESGEIDSPDIAVLASGVILYQFNHEVRAMHLNDGLQVRIKDLEYTELMIPTAATRSQCDHCLDDDDVVRSSLVPVCPKCGRRPGRKK